MSDVDVQKSARVGGRLEREVGADGGVTDVGMRGDGWSCWAF